MIWNGFNIKFGGQEVSSPCCNDDPFDRNKCIENNLIEGNCLFGTCAPYHSGDMAEDEFFIKTNSLIDSVKSLSNPLTQTSCGTIQGGNKVTDYRVKVRGHVVAGGDCGMARGLQALKKIWKLSEGCKTHHKLEFETNCVTVQEGESVSAESGEVFSSGFLAGREPEFAFDGTVDFTTSNSHRPEPQGLANGDVVIGKIFDCCYFIENITIHGSNQAPGINFRGSNDFLVEYMNCEGQWVVAQDNNDNTASVSYDVPNTQCITMKGVRITYKQGSFNSSFVQSGVPWTNEVEMIAAKTHYESVYAYAQVYKTCNFAKDEGFCSKEFEVELRILDNKIYCKERGSVEALEEGHLGGVCLPLTAPTEECCSTADPCDSEGCEGFCVAGNVQEVIVEDCGQEEYQACISVYWNGELSNVETDPACIPPLVDPKKLQEELVPFASSSTGTRTPDKALDGNINTWWINDRINNPLRTQDVIFGFEVPEDQKICEIEFTWLFSWTKSNDFDIQGSNDNTNWVTIHNETGVTFGSPQTYTYNFGTQNFSFYRLVFKAGSSVYPFVNVLLDYIAIRELCVRDCGEYASTPYVQGNCLGKNIIIGNTTNNTLMCFKPDFCLNKGDVLCIDGINGKVTLNGVNAIGMVQDLTFPTLVSGKNNFVYHDSTPYYLHGVQVNYDVKWLRIK